MTLAWTSLALGCLSYSLYLSLFLSSACLASILSLGNFLPNSSAIKSHPSLPAGLHSHALGLPWRPPGGGEAPAKPRSQHQCERQGEAAALSAVHIGMLQGGGRGAANGTQAHVVGKQWASLVSSVAVEKLQALQGACEQVLRGEKDKRPALMEAWSTGRMQDLYIYAILHHSPAHSSLYYLFIYLLTYHSSIHLFISMQS